MSLYVTVKVYVNFGHCQVTQWRRIVRHSDRELTLTTHNLVIIYEMQNIKKWGEKKRIAQTDFIDMY